MMRVWLALPVLLALPGEALGVDDMYLEGYVQAVLERELQVSGALSGVREGVVFLRDETVPDTDKDRVATALMQVPGVSEVRWTDAPVVGPPEKEPIPPSEGVLWLPERPLFEPLIADPRAPRFSAAWQEYHDDPELGSVGSVSFGALFPVVQGDSFFGGRWDFGIQAGVFSIFDLDASSQDLINSDFWIGLPIAKRWGWFALTVRPYHQSSHLGDEFLLHSSVERINLSYEAVDGLASIDLWTWGRIYGGGGYLFNEEPHDLEEKYLQAGAELVSPWAFFDLLRPVAALDMQRHEEHEWRTDYSARAGFRLDSDMLGHRRVMILGEYYNGRSPNGQFFNRRVKTYGGGVHLQF